MPILKGIFYRSKDMTRVFKMLSGVGFGKVFRMKILNPIAALFVPEKYKVMCLFYRKPDCRGGAESQHLVVPSRMAQQGVRSIPMGQCAAGTSRDHATLEAEEWVFCNHLLPVLRRQTQAHICTHQFYTAQTPESAVLQTAGQASVKRNGNLYRTGKERNG